MESKSSIIKVVNTEINEMWNITYKYTLKKSNGDVGRLEV